MSIVRTPLIEDDGTGYTGTPFDNAWQTKLYNAIDATLGGPWANIPFNAGSFLVDDGTPLTVSQIVNRWRPIGSTTVIWECSLNPVTIPKASTTLIIGGLPFIPQTMGAAYPMAWSNYGSYLRGYGAGSQGMVIARSDGAAFVAGAAWFYFSITLDATVL